MSAFYVGQDHVNAILSWVESINPYSIPMPDGTSHNGHPGNLDAALTMIGQALLLENVKSLRARYQDSFSEEQAESLCYVYEPDYSWTTQRNAALATIKLVHCYEYQTCEHDAWESSYAREFCRMVIDRAIYRVNGYDDSPWGYHKPTDSNLVRIA